MLPRETEDRLPMPAAAAREESDKPDRTASVRATRSAFGAPHALGFEETADDCDDDVSPLDEEEGEVAVTAVCEDVGRDGCGLYVIDSSTTPPVLPPVALLDGDEESPLVPTCDAEPSLTLCSPCRPSLLPPTVPVAAPGPTPTAVAVSLMSLICALGSLARGGCAMGMGARKSTSCGGRYGPGTRGEVKRPLASQSPSRRGTGRFVWRPRTTEALDREAEGEQTEGSRRWSQASIHAVGYR